MIYFRGVKLFTTCVIKLNQLLTQNPIIMKKKALILIGLCALSLCTWEAQAVNIVSAPNNKMETADPPSGYEKINLQGTLMLSVGPDGIVAGASDDAIYISFNQSFGYVNISIYNGMGILVYSTIVDTQVQPVVIIPFSNAASDTYTVELSNAFGHAEGDFDRTL